MREKLLIKSEKFEEKSALLNKDPSNKYWMSYLKSHSKPWFCITLYQCCFALLCEIKSLATRLKDVEKESQQEDREITAGFYDWTNRKFSALTNNSNPHSNGNTVRVLFSLQICYDGIVPIPLSLSLFDLHPTSNRKVIFPILFRCPGNCAAFIFLWPYKLQ